MELRQYLEILVRRKWVIILTTLVTVAVAGLGTRFQQRVYSASAMVRVAQAPSGAVEYGDYVYAERLIKTYGELVKSRPFLEQVIAGLDLSVTPQLLSQRVKVAVLPDTELLRITVEDSDPARAVAIANTLANLLVMNSQTLYLGGARSAREILEEQLSVADANLEQDRATLQTLLNSGTPQDEERIAALRTRVQLQEGIYANLLQQYEAARVSEASRANSVSVSEPAAQPIAPSRPSATLNILLGFFVGLFGGIALAFLIESLDPTLHSANQAETIVPAPLLGSIPEHARAGALQDRGGPIVVDQTGRSAASEAYRILRTEILAPQKTQDAASGPAFTIKSLLVTSPEPGTGKSTVSANLAAILTEGGRKVILVDADLRRPRLHTAFGVPDAPGLSDLLLDQRSPVASAEQSPAVSTEQSPTISAEQSPAVSTEQGDIGAPEAPPGPGSESPEPLLRDTNFPGLRVLTSGSLPPNPTELLGSERMAPLLNRLTQRADMIIVDSPPVLAVADTAILAPMVDGVLLVAARDQSTARRTQRALELLEKVGGRPLGLVFNRAQRSADDYYYHYAGREAAAGRQRAERVRLAFAVTGVLIVLCIVSVGVFALVAGPTRLQGNPALAWLAPRLEQTVSKLYSQRVLAGVTPTAVSPAVAANVPAMQAIAPLDTQAAQLAGLPASSAAGTTGANVPSLAQAGVVTTTLPGRFIEAAAGAGQATPPISAEFAPTALPELSSAALAAGASDSPTLARVGYITSREGALGGGTFLLEDPYWKQPGALWLPNGWPVEILEENILGRVSGGSNRWVRVRCNIGGQVYVGFVPARSIEE